MTITRLVKLSKKGQFVIPREIRDALKIKEGDKLMITLDGRRVVITSPQEYAKMTRGLLKGTWGKNREEVERYLERERNSWE